MDYVPSLSNPSRIFQLFHQSLHATKPLFQYSSLEIIPIWRSSNPKHTSIADHPFTNAPIELIRYILELAATNDTQTAYTLSLLSYTVHTWIDPILYSRVTLPTPTSFATALRSKSPHFLSTHVRSLRLEQAHVLQPWNPHRHITPEFISVGGMLPYVTFYYGMTMLATIKKLHFSDDVPAHLLGDVPQLTHFSCCYRPRPRAASYPALPILRYILGLPHLKVLVIHTYKERDGGMCSKREMENVMEGVLEVSDPRVVVASADPEGKWGKGLDYTWEWAEEAVGKGVKYVEVP